MAKIREAVSTPKKVNVKEGSAKKSAKAASSKAKVAGLSEERVVDSSSDEEAPAGDKVASRTPKPAKALKEKKPRTEKFSVEAVQQQQREPMPSSNDEDSGDESESDGSDEDEEMADVQVRKKPASVPAKVNGVKRKAESASSLDDGESSEEETSDEDAKPDPKRVKTALKDAGEVEQVGEAVPEEDSECGEDEEQNHTLEEPSADTRPAPPRPQHSGNLDSIPAQPFKPPNGYSGVDVTNSIFSAQSFASQQIWHIVAPSSVPLKSISSVALDAIKSGATVLTHKGTDYTLNEDTNPNNRFDSVIVPNSSIYHSDQQPITKTLHIKQKVLLPNLSKKQADVNSGSSAAADVAQPSISEVRPQPKGMRMRYKPAGFGHGDPGLGSDSEEDDAQPRTNDTKFQFPKALGAHGKAVEAGNGERPKTKKAKKRVGSDVEMVSGDAIEPSPTSAPKLQTNADANNRVTIGDLSASKDELGKEEKKRRKAERKAKKESKASNVAVAA